LSHPPVRVLFVTTSFPLYEDHWSGVFIAVQARALVKLGCQVTVLAPHFAGAPTHEQQGSLEVYRFRYLPPAWEKVAYGGGIPANLAADQSLWAAIPAFAGGLAWSLSRLISQADIIHAHWSFSGVVAAGLSAARKRPMIVSFHGSDLAGRMARAAIWAAHAAKAVVVHSSEMRQRALIAGVEERKIILLPHGVEIEAFSQAPGNLDMPRILAVGRLSQEKGFDVLLQAVAEFPPDVQWKLDLIGEGPESGALSGWSKAHGLEQKINFLGPLPHSQVCQRMSKADLLVIPSRREGFGVTLLEGMASALPIVGTRVGAMPEIIVEGETGRLVHPENPRLLSQALMRMLVNPESRRAMGLRGRRAVEEKFSATAVNRPLAQLYGDLLVRP